MSTNVIQIDCLSSFVWFQKRSLKTLTTLGIIGLCIIGVAIWIFHNKYYFGMYTNSRSRGKSMQNQYTVVKTKTAFQHSYEINRCCGSRSGQQYVAALNNKTLSREIMKLVCEIVIMGFKVLFCLLICDSPGMYLPLFSSIALIFQNN